MKLVDEEPCPCGSGKLYGDCHKSMLRITTIPANLSHLSLTIIPEPDPNTRTVFEHTGNGTIFIIDNNGRYSLDCGSCSAALAIVSSRHQVSGIVMHCSVCGKFNIA